MQPLMFTARIARVVTTPPKLGVEPLMTFLVRPRYDKDLTILARETGGVFDATLRAQELDLLGVDADLGPPVVRVALRKVAITPPKEDVGPSIALTLATIATPDAQRLMARCGQKFDVSLIDVLTLKPARSGTAPPSEHASADVAAPEREPTPTAPSNALSVAEFLERLAGKPPSPAADTAPEEDDDDAPE